jgi:dienelactone hydrolase
VGRGALGDSWYLYDGDTPRFRRSMEEAEGHLHRVLRSARAAARRRPPGTRAPDFRRPCLLGFSQGAYLAGIAALRRPGAFRAAVLVAGRLKVEVPGARLRDARGLRVLALHGAADPSVKPGPARESVEAARAAGIDGEFRLFEAGHEFAPAMRAAARAWLAGIERGAPRQERAPR